MQNVPAFAAPAAGAPLEPITITRRQVGTKDVLIAIKFAGICHSDIHTVRGEWGPRQYPLAPGHEIAGVVEAVGSEVTRFQVGDRVGVGCMVNSCGECANCRKGAEQYCLNGAVFTYGDPDRDGTITQGGYSTHIVVVENFVVRIPDALGLDVAAPLLCAGATTYSPLHRFKVGPGSKVGVIGFGGLGHVAVKIAHAMGAEVTVMSHSLNKQDDGLRLGASAYYSTQDPATFAKLTNTFDLIINTVSAPIDTEAFLKTLALDGVFVIVGASGESQVQFPSNALAGARRSFAFSMIAGIAETQEMLDFCGQHGVGAEIELISADQINAAYDRVVASDVRYRFVIDAASFATA